MADQKQLKNAETVYKTLCETMDDRGWKYEKDPEKLIIHFIVTGEDIPMHFLVHIDPERELIRLLSQMPFAFSEERRMEGAIATCQTNYKIADGNFDYDFKTGDVYFRLTSSFRESLISKDLLNYMVGISCFAVDDFNDKFLMIEKGVLSIEDFLKSL